MNFKLSQLQLAFQWKHLFLKRNTHSVRNLLAEFSAYEKHLLIPEPVLDLDYLLNKSNWDTIGNNIKFRKTHFSMNEFVELSTRYEQSKDNDVKKLLIEKALAIPNSTHPQSPRNEDFKIINVSKEKKSFDFKPKSFLSLTNKLGMCRTDNIAHYLGNRSYYFSADLCLLENAIIQYVLQKLLKLKFQLVTVADILNEEIIKRCGMGTRGERSQVYHLEPEYYGPGWCLSGTAEMGIATHLMNRKILLSDLPMKLAAMSRCYREEISDIADEKGIYRVHCFTKIEMFGVTRPEDSEQNLQQFLEFEEALFSSLGLHTRSLDMGIHELGSQAYRKFDVEAWMPGRRKWGELSSCSDCTDYQSRRLNITSDNNEFVHTINGTACAIPRLLIALVETHQNKDGTINVPACLQQFMGNRKVIGNCSGAPSLVKVKSGLSKAKKRELARAALAQKAQT